MKKFEYLVLQYSMYGPCKKDEDKSGPIVITDWKLEELGNEGWELCSCRYDGTWSKYYFKREIPQQIEEFEKILVSYDDKKLSATVLKKSEGRAVVLVQDRITLAYLHKNEWIILGTNACLIDLADFNR